MKRTAIIAGFMLLIASLGLRAQEQSNTGRPTVDSINAKYKLLEMPQALTLEQIFPVIGVYQVNSHGSAEVVEVSIALDEQNKGMVWIEGLPQGRIYAQLRKSPSTYKIPAQKSETGSAVAEGTLIYDQELKTLSISLGRPYNSLNPELAFSSSSEAGVATAEVKSKGNKTKIKAVKTKHIVYSGSKSEQTTVMN